MDNTIINRLKIIEEKINKAKLEQSVCERQLKELRPKRDALEHQCVETYGCKVSELPKQIEDMENRFVSMVEVLESSISKAESIS